MARAHFVKKARNDNPSAGIKKGDSYYWWKFMQGGRGGPKHYSKTPPKQSQLTQSEFLSQVYDLQDRIEALSVDTSSENGLADLQGEVQSIADDIRSLGEEQSDKVSNMPDSLQQGSIGEMLESRAESCEQWASDLEGVDLELEKEEGESDEDLQSRAEDALFEVQNISYEGE